MKAIVRGLIVDGFHALTGQRAGILDVLRDAFRSVRGLGSDHAPRPEFLAEGLATGKLHVAGIVLVLGLFLRVEVVKVAEEDVEAVISWQMLVAVTEVVLTKLAGGVALGLEHPGDGRVLLPHAELGARQANLGESGAEYRLTGDEGRPAGGA
jgi:hypothetical protein